MNDARYRSHQPTRPRSTADTEAREREAAAEDAPRDAAQAPAPEPPKIDVTGFVDVYYLYNFNKVDPALRSFDVQHNAFSHAPRERQAQPRRLSRQRPEQQQ